MRERHEFILSPLCRRSRLSFALLLSVLAFAPAARAQTSAGPSQPLITQSINESSLIVLSGNTRPEARNPANDRGRVADSLPMPNMILQLRRPAAQEQAFVALIDQLHDPQSPNYHHWLSASEIGAQFGPAASDIQTATGWLQQHGFTVNTVYANGMAIDFSGTAGQVRTAFHTEIHNLDVNGVTRFANMSDPQIPAALTPAVVGVVALHNIPPKPNMILAKVQYTPSGYICGPAPSHPFPCEAVTPADLATIYNFNPVFAGGNTGQGQTIYLIEATDLYLNADWTTFRSTFGLSAYGTPSLTTVHPGSCGDPGVNGASGEAILDAEYASAAAPSAAIVMVACANFVTGLNTMFGNTTTYPPNVISMSYGVCEANNGATSNAAFNTAYQTGVAEGWSIFVSTGDGGADTCDNHDTAQYSTSGIGANGFGSSVYNVAVGGTDFSDSYSGTNSTYWNSTNTATYGSAKSYIPEIPWNNSCGSQLFATHYGYSGVTYGTGGFCNSATASSDGFLNIGAGSGAPSSCATGSGATCAGWPKPSYQSGFLGNPADGVRDLPDVSLFAASGQWGHFYIYCYTDTTYGGTANCSGAPITWSTAGGTSFASPIWAGIQALINQQAGAKQGNPNYRLYQLAFKEYGTSGSSTCNASNGNTVASSCIFYDVTVGDEDVPCQSGTPNCYDPSGTYGVLSTSTGSYLPAFKAQTGWDFATGIGTVNVSKLVMGWSGSGEALTDRHDFNGDGKGDILWRDTSGDLAMWFMNGLQVIAGGVVAPQVPTVWSVVGQRDFNGDGYSDILWRDTSGNLAIWLMNGGQMLSGAVVSQVPTVWSVVGTGDFNGDGKGDILWRDSSGDLAMWFMNGTQVIAGGTIGTVPTVWSVVGTGDFNGDGYTDILWRDTSGDLAIWLMDGGQELSGVVVGTVPTTWSVVGTGDFNGDGKSDILWLDTSGNLAIWFMNGTSVIAGGVIATVPTVWSVAETGDFNGDGKSDILWRDTSGDLAIWLMNGGQMSSGAIIATVPTVWTVQGLNAD